MKVQNELFDGLRFKLMINFIAISSVVNFKVLVIKNDDFINFQMDLHGCLFDFSTAMEIL